MCIMVVRRRLTKINSICSIINISIDFYSIKHLRLVSLLILQKLMMRYIWQAAKVPLCEIGELLHNTELAHTKGLLCKNDGVEQLLHNTGLLRTKEPMCNFRLV